MHSDGLWKYTTLYISQERYTVIDIDRLLKFYSVCVTLYIRRVPFRK
jgi:hypothetical protein